MRLKSVVSILFFFFLFQVGAQEKFFFHEMDSIKIGYRSEGVGLDSVDALFTGGPELRPGAGFDELYERHLAKNLFLSPAGFSYLTTQKLVTPKYSGLPYLGFQYAFGSKLTQDLNVEYHQFFRQKTHLHFRYNRRTSNGFLRNGDYKINELNLKFYHSKGFYSTNFEGYYGAYGLAENRGIATDSLLEEFALEYTPVRNEDGRSKIRKLDLKWDNYFRLAGDSLVGFGLKTKHRYAIVNREYTEQLFDLSSVDTFYVDTNGTTRDQYQTAKFANGAGVYFDSPYFKIDASINYQHWRNQNLGKNRDTNEVFLHSNLWASFGERLSLNNVFYFNVIGAIGEIKEHAKINYQILKQLSLKGGLKFENLYPTPYQRFHTANYYKWEIEELKMQQKLQISGALKWGDTNFVQANITWTNINNGRYFINNQWRQDTLGFVSVGALKLSGGFHLRKWSFYPTVTVRFNSSNFDYQPLFSTLNRIAFTTKMFKAKKLGVSVGADVGYETGYQFMNYNGLLDLLQPVQTSVKTPALVQLNAFLALSIDQFRFFVRAQNLSYLFQDAKIKRDPNYPIMPFVIRIGITWDFFN